MKRKIKDSMILKLRKIFGMDHAKICLQKHSSLPNWMTFEMRDGIIILEGRPATHDIDELLIKVFNGKEYVIQSFYLNIADESNPEQEDKEDIENFKEEEKDEIQTNIDDTMYKSNTMYKSGSMNKSNSMYRSSQQQNENKSEKRDYYDSQFKISHRNLHLQQVSSHFLKQGSETVTERKLSDNQDKNLSVTNIGEESLITNKQTYTQRLDNFGQTQEGFTQRQENLEQNNPLGSRNYSLISSQKQEYGEQKSPLQNRNYSLTSQKQEYGEQRSPLQSRYYSLSTQKYEYQEQKSPQESRNYSISQQADISIINDNSLINISNQLNNEHHNKHKFYE